MAFFETIARAYELARSRSNTSVFLILCVLYTLMQISLEEEYPGTAQTLSNFTVFDIYFLMVANYYLPKAFRAAKYGSAYSLPHFANAAAHLGHRYIKWSDIGMQRYESLFESLSPIDSFWNACGPLPNMIITFNILYYLLVFLGLIFENHPSLTERLQITETKLAEVKLLLQEATHAHENTIASFKQAQQDFDATTVDHADKITETTTKYHQEKDNDGVPFSEVQTLRKDFSSNKAETEQLKTENKRLNIRLISPRRKIRTSLNAARENEISSAASAAEKEGLAILKIKFVAINETIERLIKTSNDLKQRHDQSMVVYALEMDCDTKAGKIDELEETVQNQAITISTLEKDTHHKANTITELERTAQSDTVNIKALDTTPDSRNKEIQIKQRSIDNDRSNGTEIKALKTALGSRDNRIATLTASLNSVEDRLISQSKNHSNVIGDRLKTIKQLKEDLNDSDVCISELNEQQTANMAQKETEKATALNEASELLARMQRDQAAALVRKDDEIKAARTFFARPVRDPTKDTETADLAKLRSAFDTELTKHKQDVTLQFEAEKNESLRANTAAVWEEAENNTNIKLKALDDTWKSSWDSKLAVYETDWENVQQTLSETQNQVSATTAANKRLSNDLQAATTSIATLMKDLQGANTSIDNLKKDLQEAGLKIDELEAKVDVDYKQMCEQLERDNLELERQNERLIMMMQRKV